MLLLIFLNEEYYNGFYKAKFVRGGLFRSLLLISVIIDTVVYINNRVK